MGIKVKATQKGFYGTLREPGDEFEIRARGDFSKHWMEAENPDELAEAAAGDSGAGGDEEDEPSNQKPGKPKTGGKKAAGGETPQA